MKALLIGFNAGRGWSSGVAAQDKGGRNELGLRGMLRTLGKWLDTAGGKRKLSVNFLFFFHFL